MLPETIIENIELIKCWWINIQIDHYQIDIKTWDDYKRIFIRPSELLKMIGNANEKIEEIDILKDSILFLEYLIKNDWEWWSMTKENWEDMNLEELKEFIVSRDF